MTRVDHRLPTGHVPREYDGAGNYTRVGIYGERTFDRHVYPCSVCNRNAFGYSVRIRQDQRSTPVCIDCRLNVTRPEKTSYPRREEVRRMFAAEIRSAA